MLRPYCPLRGLFGCPLRYVARLADLCNVGGEPDGVRHKLEVLRRHCDAEHRDYGAIEKTNIVSVLLARDAAALAAKRARSRPKVA